MYNRPFITSVRKIRHKLYFFKPFYAIIRIWKHHRAYRAEKRSFGMDKTKPKEEKPKKE
jgi:hypothetical protein